jgi:hypothetical protein
MGFFQILNHSAPLEITEMFSEKVEVAVYLVNFNRYSLAMPNKAQSLTWRILWKEVVFSNIHKDDEVNVTFSTDHLYQEEFECLRRVSRSLSRF